MGCLWSREISREKCTECGRKPVNNLLIINHVCEICTRVEARRQQATTAPTRPCYGLYHCKCGRRWDSRLSWANSYQICKRCRCRVYPHNQRPVKPSDMRDGKENVVEHQKDLCQKCQKLGHYCGRTGNNRKRY